MRFYVPEWDDRVDANYDFIHDEHSALAVDDRELAYIWDLFPDGETPIDGVLISREQVMETKAKRDRIVSNGVYDAPNLDLPAWLPTISDCGAWGYKSLPFPPYDNAEMLDFYEALGVTTGVTIDHLVLGAGHTARLYLDKRAFGDEFPQRDLPDHLAEDIDIMIDEWPEAKREGRTWPAYVAKEEPSIYANRGVKPFTQADFQGTTAEIIDRLSDHQHAVFRADDMQYRYDLTLQNARDMFSRYESGDYSFRLMGAVQGWNVESYIEAVQHALDIGYQYIGIGGVAGSSEEAVKDIVTGVGRTIKEVERHHETRVDCHVFGFAKTGAFETVGRSGMASFDSASMLRAAWTGGDNYRLGDDGRYDAIRVRYPNHRDDRKTGIRKALRAQEMLYALRAFDEGRSIATALRTWHERASTALDEAESYLRIHRHDRRFQIEYVREAEEAFRSGYEHGRMFRASFGDPISSKLVKLLREDDSENPVPFAEYAELLDAIRDVFDDWTPTLLDEIEQRERDDGSVGTLRQLWPLVESYATWDEIGNGDLLDAYKETLQGTPWRRCGCRICETYGIEVAIFRGNNRNRRRGFHNTRQFYNQFENELPKLLVLTRPSASLLRADSVEDYLRSEHGQFWRAVHDLPVAEIGVITAKGLSEWWASPPSSISFAPREMGEELVRLGERYQDVFIDSRTWSPDASIREKLDAENCALHECGSPTELRSSVLKRLGYDEPFVPELLLQSGLTEY